MRKKLGVKQILIITAVPLIIFASLWLMEIFNNRDRSEENSTEESSGAQLLLKQVPNVKSKSVSSAKKTLEELGFTVTLEYLHSTGVSKDYVIDQSVSRGNKLEPGSEIVLTVSLGPVMATVPELLGLPLAEAISLLREAGLNYSVTERYNKLLEPGLVTAINTTAGVQIEEGSIVYLYVSKEFPNVQSIQLNETYMTLAIDTGSQLIVSIYPDIAIPEEILWSSSHPQVALVDQNGYVTAKKQGTSVITVKLTSNESVYSRCTVTVTNELAIVFTDKSLEYAIRNELSNFYGPLLISDLEKITSLNVINDIDVRSIDELHFLSNLQSLVLRYSSIENVDGLATLTKLTYINLSDNLISDISGFAKLKNLEHLYLSNNMINDISPLAGCVKLKTLDLSYNLIESVLPLSGLVRLEHLDLFDNNISNIKPLTELVGLYRLSVAYNNISDISFIGNLPRLDFLDISGNYISDISPLSGLHRLSVVKINQNHIESLNPLSNLSELRSISCNDNSISSLSPLSGLEKLTCLEFAENNVSDLSPLFALKHLYFVMCGDNDLTSEQKSELIIILRSYCHEDTIFGPFVFDNIYTHHISDLLI